MKKGTSYSKKERRAITFGYLWRWGSIVIMLLIPAIVFGICNLVNTEPKIQGFVTFLSAGITMFCVGVYDIIGTVLEFKHVLVSLQLTSHIFQNINPRMIKIMPTPIYSRFSDFVQSLLGLIF